MKSDVAIVIPAYNPGAELNKIIEELQNSKFSNIIVVNDGSNKSEEFRKLKNNVILIEQLINRGKGNSLKKGFTYCKNNMRKINTIITVDADGQHKIEDINKVYEYSKTEPDSLILGSRNLDDKCVPFKSKLKNKILNKYFNKKTGLNIRRFTNRIKSNTNKLYR